MKKEIWKTIPKYQGFYEVSNFGNVRSLPRIVNCCNGTVQSKPGVLLRSAIDKSGYLYVCLNKNGKRKTFKVHRLVILAFVGLCPPGKQVRHLDGNSTNNRLDNLKYGTPSQNGFDRVLHGTVSAHCQFGPRILLTQKDVNKIRKEAKIRPYLGLNSDLAQEYGVSQGTISKIITGKTWKDSF